MALKAVNRRAYRTVPASGADERIIAQMLNELRDGKTNATGAMTLPSGSSTATLSHPSIGIQSVIIPQVLSIAARGFTWEVVDRAEGQATVTFAALSEDTDIEFAVIG